MCHWLKVSRSGYYDWRKRLPSRRSIEDGRLSTRIFAIFEQSRGTYGSPRIHQLLRQQQIRVGKKRVERLMRLHRLQGRVVKVTRRQPGLKRFKCSGENLRLNLEEAHNINQIWVADITYLKVNQRWFYLATIMDIYSRRILGWSLSRHRTVQLTITALNYAMRQRSGERPNIFHTDRGIEYTAYRYQDVLKKHGMESSFNRPGYCTDNAHMESFYHSLKAELIRGRAFTSEKQLRHALNSYINHFYNHKRLHLALGYQPPAVYEKIAA